MARIKWFSYLLNDEGQPIEGANISIYLANTETDATIYTSENDISTISSSPHLVTNQDGYFEFWMGDDSDPNGYSSTQKFKIAFDKTGVVSGHNDYISIFPAFLPVELGSNDETKDKSVSNLYAQRWENHRLEDYDETPHNIDVIDITNTDTVKNKLVSNLYAHNWENHINKDYNETPHNIDVIDITSNDTTKNKLVSNSIIKTLLGSTYTEPISAGSLSPSGDYYYSNIEHNLNDEWPIISIYNTDTKEKIIPKNIESININTIRIWLNTQINFVIKIKI